MRFSLATILLAGLPAVFAAPAGADGLDKRAPLLTARSSSKAIPGKYIVKFKDNSPDGVLTTSTFSKLKADHVYSSPGFKGFAASLDAASLDKIRSLPEVRA